MTTDSDLVDGLGCPVLILNYNGWVDTIAAIASMQSHVADIWLIDNASPDDRSGEIAERFPRVRQLSMEKNFGWAGAYNLAIGQAEAAGYDAVYLLNNDAVLRPGAVEAAVRTLRSAPDIAAVGSTLLDKNGTRAFFDGDWHWDNPKASGPLRDDVREVRTIHGGGFALSLAAYRAIGPFCEDYFLYHEETDWCLRAGTSGWRVLIDCSSQVDHEGEGSNIGANRLYYMARNRFLAKRRGIPLRGRTETNISIIEHEILQAAGLGQQARLAITEGLVDGLNGRFGQRRSTMSGLISRPLATVLTSAFRLKRKISHIKRGLLHRR